MSSDRNAPVLRAYLILGHLLFFGLFVLAYLHMPTRVVHVDSAFQIFKWIHVPGVGVEAHRFTAVVPQLLVKAVATTGASLHVLLTVASLAHVLVPYVLFVLIAHGLRLPWIAMGLVLSQVLCTRLTFYGIVLEANYLLSYPFLLAALVSGPFMRSRKPPVLLAAVAALFLVLLVHPVGFIPAVCVLVLLYLRGHPQRPVLLALVGLSAVWPLIFRALFPPTAYEADLMAATGVGLGSIPSFFALAGRRYLIDHTNHFTTHNVAFWVALLVLIIVLLRQRTYLQLAWIVASVAGFIALHVVTYHAGETAMMMEKNFVPMAAFVALPLMLAFERSSTRAAWLALVPFALVLFVQFQGISFASRPTGERLAKIRTLVDDLYAANIRKACATPAQLDARGLHIHWAMAFETLLLSSLEGRDGSATVVVREDCPPGTTTADLSGLIPEGDLCGNGTSMFRLPVGPYSVLSAQGSFQ
ncbi:MAG: hypothetical protein ACO1NQ_13955 [Flavobacteriales bacterium]